MRRIEVSNQRFYNWSSERESVKGLSKLDFLEKSPLFNLCLQKRTK